MAVGNLSFFKSSISNFAANGRQGFYKPVSPPPRIGISQSSKQIQESMLAAGADLVNTISLLSSSNISTAQTQILALQSSTVNPFNPERIELSSQSSGSLLDEEV